VKSSLPYPLVNESTGEAVHGECEWGAHLSVLVTEHEAGLEGTDWPSSSRLQVLVDSFGNSDYPSTNPVQRVRTFTFELG
jgi:hypothetical protein